jgi:hypothetical protein
MPRWSDWVAVTAWHEVPGQHGRVRITTVPTLSPTGTLEIDLLGTVSIENDVVSRMVFLRWYEENKIVELQIDLDSQEPTHLSYQITNWRVGGVEE